VSPLKIAIVGASGRLGSAVVQEALTRGHEVTAISRDVSRLAAADGVTPVAADVLDTTVSPPPIYLDEGDRTGTYRVQAGDVPIVDASGESHINIGDYAAAVVDTVENGAFIRERFTVAY